VEKQIRSSPWGRGVALKRIRDGLWEAEAKSRLSREHSTWQTSRRPPDSCAFLLSIQPNRHTYAASLLFPCPSFPNFFWLPAASIWLLGEG